jgi:hypothetical protein
MVMSLIDQFRVRDVDFNHPAMQVSMPLVSDHDGDLRCIGTGFAVAPGLAITAGHVVDDWVEYQEKRDRYKRSGTAFGVTAIQWIGDKICDWRVDAIYQSVSSDIAFLRFHRPIWWGDGPGQVKPRYARLNLNPPAEGDELCVFGFPNSALDEGRLVVSPAECKCRVLRVDIKTNLPRGYRPLSHIDIEGEIRSGMSGGPCFDRAWNVIGVNSKGWDGQQLAHVALLWPAMNVPIDLYKSGPFPALDLFKEAAQAIGYRRVHVASTGEVRLAKDDPDSLVPLNLALTEHLGGSLDFAAANAHESLGDIRNILDKAMSGTEPMDSNRVIRHARHFFWELEAMIRISLLLAARQANLVVDEPPGWDALLTAWRGQTSDPKTLDELAALDFNWNSVDLFELRTYAELGRSGVLLVQSMVPVSGEKVFAASLEPVCRRGGQQLFLPTGLDKFMDASRRFVQRLLRLSGQVSRELALPKVDAH